MEKVIKRNNKKIADTMLREAKKLREDTLTSMCEAICNEGIANRLEFYAKCLKKD